MNVIKNTLYGLLAITLIFTAGVFSRPYIIKEEKKIELKQSQPVVDNHITRDYNIMDTEEMTTDLFHYDNDPFQIESTLTETNKVNVSCVLYKRRAETQYIIKETTPPINDKYVYGGVGFLIGVLCGVTGAAVYARF
jgi:hypothetical protein